MKKAMAELKEGVTKEVDAYISGTLQQWVICEVRTK